MMESSLVASVCIPTFNRAVLLERAIASAQAQTENRIEIVISDNASTDGTPGRVARLARRDPRIRFVRNARNLGMVANWNRCLAEARAPLMCLLNDDDTLSPLAVKTGQELLTRHPQSLMAFGASRHCRDSGELLRVNRPSAKERVIPPEEAHRMIWTHNRFQITHAMFRVGAARGIGGFCEEVGWCADTDFVLRLAARGPVVVTPVEIGVYSVHAGQLTGKDNYRAYEWQSRMVSRVMAEAGAMPHLAALRPLAEREYLSRYAIHFAAAALKRGRSDEAREFLNRAKALGLPGSKPHAAMFHLLRASLALPGGVEAFKGAFAPDLSHLAARYG